MCLQKCKRVAVTICTIPATHARTHTHMYARTFIVIGLIVLIIKRVFKRIVVYFFKFKGIYVYGTYFLHTHLLCKY